MGQSEGSLGTVCGFPRAAPRDFPRAAPRAIPWAFGPWDGPRGSPRKIPLSIPWKTTGLSLGILQTVPWDSLNDLESSLRNSFH